MALIVEDGTALSTAESYVSEADADALIASLVADSTDWSALSSSGKEDALRRSTAFLDERYGGRFTGERRTREQALLWPRVGGSENGWEIPEAEVPLQVRRALAVLAAEAAKNPTVALTASLVTSGATLIAEEEDQVGDLKTRVKYAGSGKVDSGSTVSEQGAAAGVLNRVGDILRPLLVPYGTGFRG